MVSTYYLIKLFQRSAQQRLKKKADPEPSKSCSNTDKYSLIKCRICLKNEGTIPIYSDDDSSTDISSEVQEFGDIELNIHDDFSKHLCNPCYQLLKAAMLFRKTAKHANQVLAKQKVKMEQSDGELVVDETKAPATKSRKMKKHAIFQKYFSEIIEEGNEDDDQSKKKIKNVQCRICMKVITKAYYKEHFALHDPTVSKYMCDICGKSFRQRCAYRNHYFIHKSEFPYHCNYCQYRGRTPSLLNTHVRTHTGDYRYMCTECSARFLTKSNLNKHMFKHREPTLKCHGCKRVFHTKLAMERHFDADHLGIKNHICELCGKAFGIRKGLIRHQLDVHKREKILTRRIPSYLEAEMNQKMKENTMTEMHHINPMNPTNHPY